MEQTVFIDRNNIATFRCPKCGKVKTANVSQYIVPHKKVTVNCTCACAHLFRCRLENGNPYCHQGTVQNQSDCSNDCLGLIKKNWFFIAIFFVLIIGLPNPDLGKTIKPFTKPLIFCALLAMGLRQNFSSLMSSLKDYKAIYFCILTSFVFAPLVGFILGNIFFSSNHLMFVGVMIASSVSTTLVSSIVWTNITKGNESLAMVLTTTTSILFVFVAPLILYITLNTSINIPILSMVQNLFIAILSPIILAQIIRYFIKIDYNRLSNPTKIVGQSIILSIILMATSSAKGLDLSTIMTVIVSVSIQYIITALFSYNVSSLFTDKKNAIAIMYCSSQKALPNAALISMTFFDPATSIYILVYHIFQQIMGGFTIKILVKEE